MNKRQEYTRGRKCCRTRGTGTDNAHVDGTAEDAQGTSISHEQPGGPAAINIHVDKTAVGRNELAPSISILDGIAVGRDVQASAT